MLRIGLEVDALPVARRQIARTFGAGAIATQPAATLRRVVARFAIRFAGTPRLAIRADRAEAAAAFRT
jgi:hypothetical protein